MMPINKGFPPENPPQTVHRGLGIPGGPSGFGPPDWLRRVWRRLRRFFYAARMADDLQAREQFELGAGDIARLEADVRRQKGLERIFAGARLVPGIDVRTYCWSCRRWLVHRFGECPRLAGQPTYSCSCGVHTCFDAAEMSVTDEPDDSPDYVDFIRGL